MPVHLRFTHNIMIMGIAGIAVLLLWETAAAPKPLSSLLLSSLILSYINSPKQWWAGPRGELSSSQWRY